MSDSTDSITEAAQAADRAAGLGVAGSRAATRVLKRREAGPSRSSDRGLDLLDGYLEKHQADHGFVPADLDTPSPAADLIADVLHACALNGVSAGAVLELATSHFCGEGGEL
jgi:hypothetical protein